LPYNLASSNPCKVDDLNRPPPSIIERRRSSLVALAKKINLFGNNSTSTTELVDSKDPEHARFEPLDSNEPAMMENATSPTSPTDGSPKSASGRSNTTLHGNRERPHPPPLDTAAANNLPRYELNSSSPISAVTPTPPPDTSNANTNGRKPRTGTNAAGPSSPLAGTTFHVGVSEDVNRKCRRTMEDTHSYIYDFYVSGTDSGYFAIFDGHAGKSAAEYCGENFHHIFSRQLANADHGVGVPEILDRTFVECDMELDKLSNAGNNRTSGCTAVVAYTRWEDRNVPDRSAARRERKSVDGDTKMDQPRPTKVERRRVLYTGNVGDARIVLWFVNR
jgi:protein phosphatase PTC1